MTNFQQRHYLSETLSFLIGLSSHSGNERDEEKERGWALHFPWGKWSDERPGNVHRREGKEEENSRRTIRIVSLIAEHRPLFHHCGIWDKPRTQVVGPFCWTNKIAGGEESQQKRESRHKGWTSTYARACLQTRLHEEKRGRRRRIYTPLRKILCSCGSRHERLIGEDFGPRDP